MTKSPSKPLIHTLFNYLRDFMLQEHGEITMTASQKLYWKILLRAYEFKGIPAPTNITASNIGSLYEAMYKDEEFENARGCAESEVRESGEPTGFEKQESCQDSSKLSRYYESEEVAAEMPDGTWVGWTFWSGGGKHGEPEYIDWVKYAYDVVRKLEVRTINIFSLPD